MKLYNRKSKSYVTEKEYGSKALDFLYTTPAGRFLLKFISNPLFSQIVAIYYKSSLSKWKIDKFCKEYNIKSFGKYATFNSFFARNTLFKLCKPNEFPAVADSKLLVVDVDDVFNIKGSVYNTATLVNNTIYAENLIGYKALIFRLSVTDIHRYIMPDDAEILSRHRIKGKLHTIRPISKDYKIFHTNSREISVMMGANVGFMVQVEVGALLVGKIKNRKADKFKKFDEKGYFEFGGSTIILFVDPGRVKIDEDILEQSELGYETIVKRGERIGSIVKN